MFSVKVRVGGWMTMVNILTNVRKDVNDIIHVMTEVELQLGFLQNNLTDVNIESVITTKVVLVVFMHVVWVDEAFA